LPAERAVASCARRQAEDRWLRDFKASFSPSPTARILSTLPGLTSATVTAALPAEASAFAYLATRASLVSQPAIPSYHPGHRISPSASLSSNTSRVAETPTAAACATCCTPTIAPRATPPMTMA